MFKARRLGTVVSHAYCDIAALVLSFGLLSACASQAPMHSYEYRPKDGFVRIQAIEPGAPDNTHPAFISARRLHAALTMLRVSGASIETVPLFDNAELVEFLPPVISALRKAGPKEDIGFAIAGKRGLLGRLSGTTFTTGRVFVRDEKINIIFGQVHERYEDPEGRVPVELPFVVGSRYRRIESTWRIEGSGTKAAEGRSDWVVISADSVSDETTPTQDQPLSTSTTDSESRFQEIERRLRLLDQLKQKGLVTEEEYQERRKAILRDI